MPQKPLTSNLSQVELVTLATYLIGGDRRPVDTEDVAVKAHELAPTRFSWRKHPEQINLELVRVYLSAAKNPEKGGFLDGSGKTGWSLTPRGVAWVNSAGKKFIGEGLDRRREETAGGPPGEQRYRRERERVLGTRAWSLWSQGRSEIAKREAEEVFRIDSYAVGRMRTLKVARLCSLFEGDAEVSQFLEQMATIVRKAGGL